VVADRDKLSKLLKEKGFKTLMTFTPSCGKPARILLKPADQYHHVHLEEPDYLF